METSLLLLLPTNPMIWILVVAVFLLLFGANRIPKLARALGESERALHEGLAGDDVEEKTKRN